MPENLKKIDWVLLLSILPLLAAGLVTMKSFDGGSDYFFWRQIVWIILGLAVFFGISFLDLRWLRHSLPLILIYFLVSAMLLALVIFGEETKGAASWIRLGAFSLEPSELAKISLILIHYNN